MSRVGEYHEYTEGVQYTGRYHDKLGEGHWENN